MRYLALVLLIVLLAGTTAPARADYRSPYEASRTHYDVRGVSPYVYSIEPTFAHSWEGWRRDRAIHSHFVRENRYRDSLARARWYDDLLGARPWYRPMYHPGYFGARPYFGTRYDYYGQFGRYGVYNNIPQSTLGRPQLDRFPRSNVHPRPDPNYGSQRPRAGVYSGARRGR